MLQPGDTLGKGRYEIEGVLGKGGMATVYLVRDTRLRIQRALKILDPELSVRAGLRQRFEVEAHSMAKLSHPNIVKVFDVVDDGTHFYIVMELISGRSVLDRTEDGPLELEPALRITSGVLAALQDAHAAKIVHRDIKPHNLLLAEDDTVRVSDFGIAQCADFGDRSVTRTGAVMGTWAFMAPEQRADAKGVDSGADIYSTGATLYAMVTGLTPPDLFAAEIDPAMYEDVPNPVREIIRKATRYWAWERYTSASEMRADVEIVLERVITGQGLHGLSLRLQGEPEPEPGAAAPPEPIGLPPAGETASDLFREPEPRPKPVPSQARHSRPSPAPAAAKRMNSTWLFLGVFALVCAGVWMQVKPEPTQLGDGPSAAIRSPTPGQSPAPQAAAPADAAAVPTGRPTLQHTPPDSASIHEQVEVRAVVTGSQAYDQVTVHFRAAGEAAWRAAKMNRAGGGYRGYIPTGRTMTDGLEYYIEAKSYASSNAPLLFGSAKRPHKLSTRP